jgi:hypothetical protein
MILDALKEMVQWYLEDGRALPQPKLRVHDRKAVLVEAIRVGVHLRAGARA